MTSRWLFSRAALRGFAYSALIHAPLLVWAIQLGMDPQIGIIRPETYEVDLDRTLASAREERSPEREPEQPSEQADAVPAVRAEALATAFEHRSQRSAELSEPARPAAAQAGRVLTRDEGSEADSDEVHDFTILQGQWQRFAGGVTSSTGTAERAVRDPRAVGSGVPDKGVGAPVAPRKAEKTAPAPEDRSRPAHPSSLVWDCPFPEEADKNAVNYARVMLIALITPEGRPQSVTVVSDPGFGFGAAARRCAMGQTFEAARNASGAAVASTTPPFAVTFKR